MSVISSLADAIQRMEGYFPGSMAYRNNNPGNMRAAPGNYPKDANGFVIFPTYDAGRAALENDLAGKIGRGMTLSQIIYAWAPPTDNNDTINYITSVSTWTGLPIDQPLSGVSPGSPHRGPIRPPLMGPHTTQEARRTGKHPSMDGGTGSQGPNKPQSV